MSKKNDRAWTLDYIQRRGIRGLPTGWITDVDAKRYHGVRRAELDQYIRRGRLAPSQYFILPGNVLCVRKTALEAAKLAANWAAIAAADGWSEPPETDMPSRVEAAREQVLVGQVEDRLAGREPLSTADLRGVPIDWLSEQPEVLASPEGLRWNPVTGAALKDRWYDLQAWLTNFYAVWAKCRGPVPA